MGNLFGGGKTKSEVQGRSLTSQEIALIGKQVQLAEAQLQAVKAAMSTQADPATVTGLLQEQIEVFRSELAQLQEDPTGQEDLTGFSGLMRQAGEIGADVGRGMTASPEDQRMIEEAANQAIEAGLIDVERFRSQSMDDLFGRVAPSRGLRPGDSPILDRGGDIIAESTRQAGSLISNIRGAQAQNMLQFPLARRQSDLSAVGMQAQVMDFQRVLRDNAFANRLRLGAALGDIGAQQQNFGLGLASGIPTNVGGTLAAIAGAQPQSSSRTAPQDFATGLANIGQIAGGAGALMGGLALVSSRTFKERVAALDPEALRDRVKLLTLDRWRWRGERDRSEHIGPYAEEMRDLFGVGDGISFPIYDALGVLFAMVKSLDAKVSQHG
jgi:hypothetical protein